MTWTASGLRRQRSGSIDVANRLVDSIADRFFLLSGHPYLGRVCDDDFGAGSRSFPVGEYVIVYCVEDGDVFILRVA
jgi:toxin ParE1/3/4